MKIVVYGLWHLGCVTAACLAKLGHEVVGLDLDAPLVSALQQGRAPIEEPGLSELIAAGQAAGRLSFSSEPAQALRDAQILYVAFDTPVNERDEADVGLVRARLESIAEQVGPGTLVFVSSQVPVGFTRCLAADWSHRGLRYGYSPENLRLGKAIDVFMKPERVIVGLSDPSDRHDVTAMFAGIAPHIEWMSLESAEMTKHALNAFLACSVTFINELARLCEMVGADAKEVERGLKSEGRIGIKAYLAPGAAFAGGTLARDVSFLTAFGRQHKVPTPLFDGVLASNDAHKSWVRAKASQLLSGIGQPVAAVLGLTYKPGTNTLRRSASVELCTWLSEQGAVVRVHDPAVHALPSELQASLTLCESIDSALEGADLAIMATEWPIYRVLEAPHFVKHMRRPQVIDQNHFLAKALATDERITYVATGTMREAKQGAARRQSPTVRTSQPSTAAIADRPMPKLLGRGAIITGASQGLGRAIAEAYLEQGASVLLVARSQKTLEQTAGELRPLATHPNQKLEWLCGDVGDAESCRAMARFAVERLPSFQILVNNAGIYGPMGAIEDVDWNEWLEAMRINLFGTVAMCRAAIPHLRAQGYGKIINLSGGGATAPLPRISAYAASKAAVVRLTETFAEELKEAHVDVNSIAPGALNTRLLEQVLQAGPERVGSDFYRRSLKQRDEGGAPLERGAGLAVFLASAESDGITGRLISAVWDDWAELPRQREQLAKSDVYTLRRIVPKDRGWT